MPELKPKSENRSPRLAFVIDALPAWGGAERLLETALESHPDAPVYTLVYNRPAFAGSALSRRQIHTSFIDRLPGAKRHYRQYLPLLPLAIEQFDLSSFDIIVSMSYAVAHGVLTRPDQLHISYVHTPMRYAWQDYHAFTNQPGIKGFLQKPVLRFFMHYFRLWDIAASNRVDCYQAVSHWTAQCLWRAYRRTAEVVYPPVDIERFHAAASREDYYITVSRLVLHKRVDVLVQAFNQLGLPLIVIGEGSEKRRLEKMAASNVHFLGWQSDQQVADLLSRARAFLHAAEEDFGIAMVEAQAAGCPVIAFHTGGAQEIISESETGYFFTEQSPQAVIAAVKSFEQRGVSLAPEAIRKSAMRFTKPRFLAEFEALIQREWSWFRGTEQSEITSISPVQFAASELCEEI